MDEDLGIEDDETELAEAIALELRSCRPGGRELSAMQLEGAVRILELTAETASPQSTGRTVLLSIRAFELLRRAVRRLEPWDRRAARVFLGWTEASRPATMQQRCKSIGDSLGVSAETARSQRELPTYRMVARSLLSVVESSHATNAGSPFDSRLNIPWLDMSRHYSRAEGAAVATKIDLTRARIARSEQRVTSKADADRTKAGKVADYRELAALYWFTVVSALDVERDVAFGGQWLLALSDAEEVAADAFFILSALAAPFDQIERSRLRRILRQDPDWEIDAFADAVGDRQPALLKVWHDWLATCECRDDDFPNAACRVHQLFDAVDDFSGAIRAHWNALTDWYPALHDSPLDLDASPFAGPANA